MKAVIIIPARFASSRFPGKPLALIAGRSLIQRVYERVTASQRARAVIVATDDMRIAEHVGSFGGRVIMTPSELPSGTDRIAAALRILEHSGERFDQIINVQGDEPLIEVGDVDRLILALQSEPDIDIATLATPIDSEADFGSRDIVKVVTTLAGDALYFSRSPIPHGGQSIAARHVGIYAYQAAALSRFTLLPPSTLEVCESLEQLRALQNGFRIRVLRTDKPHVGVDRPEDVEKVESELLRLQMP
jgi:3-deoxy-manno-octulosonate cytidylyltransferase (CMP-KDO synthetase)